VSTFRGQKPRVHVHGHHHSRRRHGVHSVYACILYRYTIGIYTLHMPSRTYENNIYLINIYIRVRVLIVRSIIGLDCIIFYGVIYMYYYLGWPAKHNDGSSGSLTTLSMLSIYLYIIKLKKTHTLQMSTRNHLHIYACLRNIHIITVWWLCFSVTAARSRWEFYGTQSVYYCRVRFYSLRGLTAVYPKHYQDDVRTAILRSEKRPFVCYCRVRMQFPAAIILYTRSRADMKWFGPDTERSNS